jgi:hypothetical protein
MASSMVTPNVIVKKLTVAYMEWLKQLKCQKEDTRQR